MTNSCPKMWLVNQLYTKLGRKLCQELLILTFSILFHKQISGISRKVFAISGDVFLQYLLRQRSTFCPKKRKEMCIESKKKYKFEQFYISFKNNVMTRRCLSHGCTQQVTYFAKLMIVVHSTKVLLARSCPVTLFRAALSLVYFYINLLHVLRFNYSNFTRR